MYTKFFKRAFDLIISTVLIIIVSPLMVLLAIWIKIDSPGPIIFKQKRCGQSNTYFQIYKFRTMRCNTPKDVPTHLLDNSQNYITHSGSFLRRTSLDELPQLFNIFKGDMSFIGPRPALWNQDDLMALRHENGSSSLRPGLSGWAQIHGRDEISVIEKAYLDGEYFQNISFFLDVKCLMGTIRPVLKQTGFNDSTSSSQGCQKSCSYFEQNTTSDL